MPPLTGLTEREQAHSSSVRSAIFVENALIRIKSPVSRLLKNYFFDEKTCENPNDFEGQFFKNTPFSTAC